jgi:exosortase D (VPLPA-CTERM-specific)
LPDTTNFQPSKTDETHNAGRLLWIISAVLGAAAFAYVFRDGLIYMIERWDQEEYSHGSLIPIITLFLIWQKKDALAAMGAGTSLVGPAGWVGALIVLGGILVGLIGELSTIYLIIQYGFLMTILGVAMSLVGFRGLKLIWAPLLYLVFMVPLPSFLYANLSAELQLISSELGVAFVRWFNIPVFLEGNVIDLGIYKLQVVEACSGLRYLFPLMSFGYLSAYLYRGPVWHRLVLFLSTIPITIVMNSFRIGVIGVAVDRWGIEMAEGALHFFEGWVIFMACVAILFLEIWLFVRFTGGKRSFTDSFRIELPDRSNGWMPKLGGTPTRPWLAAVVVLILATVGSLAIAQRTETVAQRESLEAFPMQHGNWFGKGIPLEKQIVEALKLTDYVNVNYAKPDDRMPVNLYAAFYASQRKGEAVHSPRSCIPGGGWQIESVKRRTVSDVTQADGQPLEVNRVIIAKGPVRQVVYYWFAQRGRNLTNEYLVKWYLFWDGMTRNRTDGALVRLVTPVRPNEDTSVADKRLVSLLKTIYPKIGRYIPA